VTLKILALLSVRKRNRKDRCKLFTLWQCGNLIAAVFTSESSSTFSEERYLRFGIQQTEALE